MFHLQSPLILFLFFFGKIWYHCMFDNRSDWEFTWVTWPWTKLISTNILRWGYHISYLLLWLFCHGGKERKEKKKRNWKRLRRFWQRLCKDWVRGRWDRCDCHEQEWAACLCLGRLGRLFMRASKNRIWLTATHNTSVVPLTASVCASFVCFGLRV